MAGTANSLIPTTTTTTTTAPISTHAPYSYTEPEAERITVLLEVYPEQSDLIYCMASCGRTPALIYQMIQDLIAPVTSLDSSNKQAHSG
eukprot:13950379-Ditylum_brightwellii.AAC.1